MENFNKELTNKIKRHLKESNSLRNIHFSKGFVKLSFIYDLVDNKIKMPSNDPNIYLEVYTFFIRMRRFIFKWTNYIEDFLTAKYIDNNSQTLTSLENILTKKTFGVKSNEHFKDESFYKLFEKVKKINKIKSYDEYLVFLDKIINLRNLVSHIDLFFLSIKDEEENKIKTISEIQELIKYFLPKKMDIKYQQKDWKTFDNQWTEVVVKFDEIKNNKEELEKIINKIIELDFSKINFFKE